MKNFKLPLTAVVTAKSKKEAEDALARWVRCHTGEQSINGIPIRFELECQVQEPKKVR